MSVLIGLTPSRLSSDRRSIEADFDGPALSFVQDNISDVQSLFGSLTTHAIWQSVSRIHLGPSMRDLHPTMLAAVVSLIKRSAPHAELHNVYPMGNDAAAARLASWITSMLETLDEPDGLLSAEVNNQICSGAIRAKRIGDVLAQLEGSGEFTSFLDIGSGTSVIPFMLFTRELPSLGRADFLEPKRQTRQAGEALWCGLGVKTRFMGERVEKVALSGPYDVIMMSRMILLTAPEERGEMFRRIANALAAGGILLVNEGIRSEQMPDRPDRLWEKTLRLAELIALLSIVGQVRVFHRANQWSTPVDPSSIASDDNGFDTLFVVQKR